MTTRTAIVTGNGVTVDRVEAFMPSNYSAHVNELDQVIVEGTDSCGWTLDDYVIPRLASGSMFAIEVVDLADHLDSDGTFTEDDQGNWSAVSS